MVKAEVIVNNPTGLHARPAAGVAKIAKQYQCELKIRKGEIEVNPKSVISILKAGMSQGSQLKVTADGVNEAEALEEILQYIQSLSE